MIAQVNDVAPATAEQLLPLVVSTPLPRVRLVRVAGELDLLTQPRLVHCVDDTLRGRPRHLILDMSGIRFMGASGLHAMVYARDTSEQHGAALHVTGAGHRAVAKLMGIVGLDQLLTMHRTWADALTAITQ